MLLFLPQTLIPIRKTTEKSHRYGLGFVGEGSEDDSGFERDAVDCLKGERYDKMEGTETFPMTPEGREAMKKWLEDHI